MYDTARRVALVKKRVRDNTRRRQRRSVYGLSAACMLLFAALIQAEGMAIEQGETAAQAGGRCGLRGSRRAGDRLYAAARAGEAKKPQ